jgi:cephalosporin-C deacetylase-like acetyl esterase
MTAVDFARFAIVPKDKVSFPSAGRYRFSIWVRAGEGFQITDGVPGFVLRLNMSPSPPAMTLFYILPDGRVGQDHLPAGTAASLPTTWTQVGAVLDIPTNVTTLVPNLFMWGGKGEIFVDDLSVEKVPDNTPLTPVLPASDAHAPASSPTASSATSGAPLLSVRPDRSDGVYATGETAVWTVDLLSGDRSAFAAVPYEIRQDGADVVARGVVNLSAGPAQITATRHDPGVLVVAVLAKNGAKDLRQLGGAVFDPYKIAPAGPTPSDFDSFWKSKLQDLAAIPIHPVETTESLEGSPAGNGIDYSKITLDNIWNTHVQGQLARPSGPGKFPAMLILQYAGVYPLAKDPVVKAAQQGFMALNIQAHDIPIDAPASYYETLKATTLKNYTSIGIESRDTSYFVRMLMGAVRAAQYLMSRPDWDGKVLLVTGESQGGLQAFATAALCPGVTSVMTYVPAGCDVFAPEGHPPRGGSWPSVYFPKKSDDPDGSKARRVLAYFDTASFAARIHCPAFIAVGLIDETARPAGVFAAYNSIPRTDKEIMIFPLSDHHGAGNARQAAYLRADIWKKAMQRGAPLPPTS